MTGSNDIDRLLGAYFDDGPRRAPERAVEAAIAHARTHPRRRDPLLFLRPDVMGRRPTMLSPQLAWAMLLVALTVGVVAAVAIGSRPDQAPVVPPPSVVVSPSPSVVESAPPSVAPTPSTFSVVVTDEHDGSRTVEVTDASGTVVNVESGPAFTGELAGDVAATNDPDDPARVHVTWTFNSCSAPAALTIDETGTELRLEPSFCDPIDTLGGNPLQLTLVFAEPVDATSLDIELVETL